MKIVSLNKFTLVLSVLNKFDRNYDIDEINNW